MVARKSRKIVCKKFLVDCCLYKGSEDKNKEMVINHIMQYNNQKRLETIKKETTKRLKAHFEEVVVNQPSVTLEKSQDISRFEINRDKSVIQETEVNTNGNLQETAKLNVLIMDGNTANSKLAYGEREANRKSLDRMDLPKEEESPQQNASERDFEKMEK
jgi:hypothetical protein